MLLYIYAIIFICYYTNIYNYMYIYVMVYYIYIYVVGYIYICYYIYMIYIYIHVIVYMHLHRNICCLEMVILQYVFESVFQEREPLETVV